MHCITAEQNYSVGEEFLAASDFGGTTGASGQGLVSVNDATNLNIRFGGNSVTFTGLNKSTGNFANLTDTDWKVIFRAYVNN